MDACQSWVCLFRQYLTREFIWHKSIFHKALKDYCYFQYRVLNPGPPALAASTLPLGYRAGCVAISVAVVVIFVIIVVVIIINDRDWFLLSVNRLSPLSPWLWLAYCVSACNMCYCCCYFCCLYQSRLMSGSVFKQKIMSYAVVQREKKNISEQNVEVTYMML